MIQKIFLRLIIIIALSIPLVISCAQKVGSNNEFTYVPKDGYVPNQETAIKIAEAIWFPVYGDKIYESKPFVAKLKGEVWVVEGTVKEGYHGGAPYIEIQKNDCKILKMYHGK